VVGGALRLPLATRPRQIAHAEVIAAQVRPAPLHAFGQPRLLWVETRARAFRVAVRAELVIRRVVPVGAPLPHVTGHVAEAEAIGGERADRGGPGEAVLQRVLVGKLPLPGVRHELAAGRQLFPPAEALT